MCIQRLSGFENIPEFTAAFAGYKSIRAFVFLLDFGRIAVADL
jgi:hypothetical protein